jgi:hypothetical protein
MTMRQASIARWWIIVVLLVLGSISAIYNGFDAVAKQALIESALFQKNTNLLQTIGMMRPTQYPRRPAP